jgi:hypothetical protein
MNPKILIFILALVMPGLASAEYFVSESMILGSIAIIIGIHMVVLFAIGVCSPRTGLFYMLIVFASFFVYFFFINAFFSKTPIDMLFMIIGYLALVGFPWAATYLFYRKTRKLKTEKEAGPDER